MSTMNGPRPELRDYMAKWSTVAIVAHEQERSAREEYAAADRVWLEARCKALTEQLTESDRASTLNLQLLREARAQRDALQVQLDKRTQP